MFVPPMMDEGTISIHALREEGDLRILCAGVLQPGFLSTPSARRATLITIQFQKYHLISIHALREEGDCGHLAFLLSFGDFYPRPPRGGRLMHLGFTVQAADISIHALREEGDIKVANHRIADLISIHALREEGDTGGMPRPRAVKVFLSTPSARRATMPHPHLTRDEAISIHALREEGDHSCVSLLAGRQISIHALREEGDKVARVAGKLHLISIHALREEGDRLPGCSRSVNMAFLSTPSARRATF